MDLGDILGFILNVVQIAIFANVIISWIPSARESKFSYYLGRFVEPILSPIRKLFSKYSSGSMMNIDFSPLVALLLINLIQGVVVDLF